jgi:NTE family protein
MDRIVTKGRQKKTVNLALQGGGAHGAFTWGALDRLLEEEAIAIEGITATSAGAMNAAALKHGWLQSGADGAKASLKRFWFQIAGLDGKLSDAMIAWLRAISPSPAFIARAIENSPAMLASEAITRVFSPYQLNPFNYHPMRQICEELLDYDLVCASNGPKLFVCATNVRTGKPRVFTGKEITPDALLASACLPTLFQAIRIEDPRSGRLEAYWDGGYMGNPALYPLFYHTTSSDILIVHINPIERDELPQTAQEIMNRLNEISFNSSLLRELRTIELVNRLLDQGVVKAGTMKRNNIHSIRDDKLMAQLGVATKLTPNRALLLQLHDAGHAAMDGFLRAHWREIGRCSSVDLKRMFAPDALPIADPSG